MKIKVVFVNGMEREFTVEGYGSFRDYKGLISSTANIEELIFKEAIVPYDKVLYIEEAYE